MNFLALVLILTIVAGFAWVIFVVIKDVSEGLRSGLSELGQENHKHTVQTNMLIPDVRQVRSQPLPNENEDTSDASSLPGTVNTYLQHYAYGGVFIAYWTHHDAKNSYCVMTDNSDDKGTCFMLSSFPKVVGHWGHQLFSSTYTLEEFQEQSHSLLLGAEKKVKKHVMDYVAGKQ